MSDIHTHDPYNPTLYSLLGTDHRDGGTFEADATPQWYGIRVRGLVVYIVPGVYTCVCVCCIGLGELWQACGHMD